MDENIVPGGQDDGVAKLVLASYDAPAFVRRARQVESAYQELIESCRRQRDKMAITVRLRLGELRMLAGDWGQLRPLLADEKQLAVLQELEQELRPQPRRQLAPTASARKRKGALAGLAQSIAHFNCRWQVYLPTVDLGPVNALREGYNRYYVLEKECALRSPKLARIGFVPLEPLTTADLEKNLAALPIPQLAK